MSENAASDSDPLHDDALIEAADRLEHIVDDTPLREQASAWAYEQLAGHRDADELLAELLAHAWPTELAESIIEEQRRATRHLRGVITREEIAVVAEKRYRNAFRMAFRLAVGGIPLMVISFLMSHVTRRHPWPKPGRKAYGFPVAPGPSPEDIRRPPPTYAAEEAKLEDNSLGVE